MATRSGGGSDSRIVRGWTKRECPIVNGILYADDSLVRLEIQLASETGCPVAIRGATAATLKDVEDNEGLRWTSISELCEARAPAEDMITVAGEGGFGEDGFVALLNQSGDLSWIAFFDCSNPFVKVSLTEVEVRATSNTGQVWTFPVLRPDTVTLTSP